jgi:hypothetical protein
MKKVFTLTSAALITVMLTMFFVSDASAQRRGGFRGGFSAGIRLGGVHLYSRPFGGFGFGINLGGIFRPRGYMYPRAGFHVSVLPYGYYPFYVGPDQYFYAEGTFSKRGNDGYEVAAPPVGAELPKLPKKAHAITIDGEQYFELNGVYYKEEVNAEGKKVYVVAGKDGVLNTGQDDDYNLAKEGDVVRLLPEDCRKVNLNGKKYFVSPDEVYYEEFTDVDNKTSYRVVSVPSATNEQ